MQGTMWQLRLYIAGETSPLPRRMVESHEETPAPPQPTLLAEGACAVAQPDWPEPGCQSRLCSDCAYPLEYISSMSMQRVVAPGDAENFTTLFERSRGEVMLRTV